MSNTDRWWYRWYYPLVPTIFRHWAICRRKYGWPRGVCLGHGLDRQKFHGTPWTELPEHDRIRQSSWA